MHFGEPLDNRLNMGAKSWTIQALVDHAHLGALAFIRLGDCRNLYRQSPVAAGRRR